MRNIVSSTLGALTAATQHNATIAEWKYHHLEQAARTFAVALASFVLTPLVLLLGTLSWGAWVHEKHAND
jgi:hypothetical protein